MAKRDFDKELDVYLSTRKKGKPFSFKEFFAKLMPKKDEIIDVSEKVEVYPDVEKVKVEKQVNKEPWPWLKKIFALPKKKKQEKSDTDFKLLAEDAVSDLKVLTKITLESIKHLPKDEVKKFRESDNFARLKKILKKHELIK